jgi:hypothetical protein
MRSIFLTPEIAAVAQRVIWFEDAGSALADPVRFLAYVMTYGTHEDMTTVRRQISDSDFIEALDHAPAGIIDPRSWAYWNSKMGRYPAPPLPERDLSASDLPPQGNEARG